MSTSLSVEIRVETDVARAALEATLFSRAAGCEETPSRLIATAVSELARNILKYANRGKLHLRRIDGGGKRGIEIEALDGGPGISDPEVAMQDHYSSGGTLGLGLPGVKRMMDEFSLDSTPGEGTRIKAVKWI